MSVTCMGVQQVPGGLDVAVMRFGGVEPQVVYAARHRGDHDKLVRELRGLVLVHSVKRALVSPNPDSKLAALLIRARPDVFALEAGSSHTGASLAEVAHKRIEAMSEPVVAATAAPVQVASVEHVDDRTLIVDVYVPPGEPTPTHAVIPLEGAEPLERPDGARILTQKIGLHEIGLTQLPPAGVRSAVLSLAPTTVLPQRGWTVVVSIYAGDNSLIHEQVLTEGQLLGLSNLIPEATRQAAEWLSPAEPRPDPLPPGPYTARFEIFAGPTSVYVDGTTPADAVPSSFAHGLAGVGGDVAAWIEANAITVEAANPGINLPPPEPYATPDISVDTYDYPDGGVPPNPLA